MNKKNEITNDVIMSDIMLRLASMEKLLIDKNFFTKEEMMKTADEIAEKATKVILEKAKNASTIGEFIVDLEKTAKLKRNQDN